MKGELKGTTDPWPAGIEKKRERERERERGKIKSTGKGSSSSGSQFKKMRRRRPLAVVIFFHSGGVSQSQSLYVLSFNCHGLTGWPVVNCCYDSCSLSFLITSSSGLSCSSRRRAHSTIQLLYFAFPFLSRDSLD